MRVGVCRAPRAPGGSGAALPVRLPAPPSAGPGPAASSCRRRWCRAPGGPSLLGARRGRAPRDRLGGGARPWRGRWQSPARRSPRGATQRRLGRWPPRSPPGAASAVLPARNKGRPCASFPRPAPARPPRRLCAGSGARSLRGGSSGLGPALPPAAAPARPPLPARGRARPRGLVPCAFVRRDRGRCARDGRSVGGAGRSPPWSGSAFKRSPMDSSARVATTRCHRNASREARPCCARWAQPPAFSAFPLSALSLSSSSAAQHLLCEEQVTFCGITISCNMGAPVLGARRRRDLAWGKRAEVWVALCQEGSCPREAQAGPPALRRDVGHLCCVPGL